MKNNTNILHQLRTDRLNSYRHSPQDIEAHFREEGQVQSDYHRRFVYELIQNADDALETGGGEEGRRLKFVLRDDVLLVANNGRPVGEEDVQALCTMSYTTKSARDDRRASIGHKGKGFSSVLEITENPQVYSTDCSFEFERDKSRREIEALLEELEETQDITGIPLMRLPFEAPDPPQEVQRLFDDGFQTVFRFPLSVNRQPGIQENVAEALRSLDPNTVVFLKHLDSLEVSVDGETRCWEVERGRVEGPSGTAPQRVELRQYTGREPSTPMEEQVFALFARRDIPIEGHTGGISENTWGDVSLTEVAVAIPLVETDEGWMLEPFESRPDVHVFLPTRERSPYPILVNGAFHSSISRTHIEVEADREHYNRFLLEQVADVLATDVRDFAEWTGNWKAFIGCLVHQASAATDEGGVTLQSRLVHEVREAFQDVAFVPTMRGGDAVRVDEVRLPYYSSKQRSIATGICDLVGESDAYLPGKRNRPLVAKRLLTKRHVRTLEALGIVQMSSRQIPGVLAQLPKARTKIKRSRTDGELSEDPVLEVILATWKTISADDEEAAAFREACQRERVFPVGKVRGHGLVRRVAKGGDTLFFPPEVDLPDVSLSGVHFLSRELYRPRSPVASQDQAELIAELKPALESIWDVREFQFQEVLRAAVRPKLIGNEEGSRDELEDIGVFRLLARLAEDSVQQTPLPYTERKKRRVLFDLSKLPLPTRSGSWELAYTLYFGNEWYDDSEPAARRVEPLVQRADIDVRFLAAPEAFDCEGLENEEERERLERFLRWLGVSPHLRLRPLFSPDDEQRVKSSEGLSDPGGTHLSQLPKDERDAYLEHICAELEQKKPRERSYLYRVHALDRTEELVSAASEDLGICEMLLQHLAACKSEWAAHGDSCPLSLSAQRPYCQPTRTTQQLARSAWRGRAVLPVQWKHSESCRGPEAKE